MKGKIIFILLTILVITSCEKDDVINNKRPLTIYALPTNDTLQGLITENTSLSRGRNWYLKGIVYVVNESSLHIDSGTIIRMIHENNDHPASGIIVGRGAKLVAQGTANHPVYFKIADSVLYRKSAWNGIIILGKAPSDNTDITFNHFPWIKNSLGYAGNEPDDSSGVMEHLTIESNLTVKSGLHLISTGTRTIVKDIKVRTKNTLPLK